MRYVSSHDITTTSSSTTSLQCTTTSLLHSTIIYNMYYNINVENIMYNKIKNISRISSRKYIQLPGRGAYTDAKYLQLSIAIRPRETIQHKTMIIYSMIERKIDRRPIYINDNTIPIGIQLYRKILVPSFR